MTSNEYTFWLQGFLDRGNLSAKDVVPAIHEKLKSVRPGWTFTDGAVTYTTPAVNITSGPLDAVTYTNGPMDTTTAVAS